MDEGEPFIHAGELPEKLYTLSQLLLFYQRL